jgi:hypothetical protein
MDESTKFNPCAECSKHCKPVFAILMIVLGVILLLGDILHKNVQKQGG